METPSGLMVLYGDEDVRKFFYQHENIMMKSILDTAKAEKIIAYLVADYPTFILKGSWSTMDLLRRRRTIKW